MAVAVIDLVWDLRSADPTTCTRAESIDALQDVAGLRRYLDGAEVAHTANLLRLAQADPSTFPEHDIATATRSSLRSGERAAARASTAGAVPELGAALAEGEVSGAHVDAVTAALRDLTPAQRRLLAGHGERLARLAAELAPDEFRRQVAKLARSIQADDGVAKLARQQRAVRLRHWIDKVTGMMRMSGEFDPETGGKLIKRIEAQAETLFHASTPPSCPDDPIARQQFLQAHALLDLTGGNPGDPATSQPTGAGTSGVRWKTEMVITIDHSTLLHGWHAGSRVDCGIEGLELPLDTIRRMALFADIIPVLLDENGVVLKMGRTRRLATNDQRLALRAMYRTCAMPGCTTPVGRCTPHHCDEWEHGGLTDIELLAPVCKHDHATIHANGWTLHLAIDRSLTVRGPDGSTIMTTGPPAEQWQ
ncbi:MAG: hypothetical protein JWN99_2134 [Ilumatobacteraceae bacterium]|nr:hypothetical protein [Ilumatobacteraceae bacterium]